MSIKFLKNPGTVKAQIKACNSNDTKPLAEVVRRANRNSDQFGKTRPGYHLYEVPGQLRKLVSGSGAVPDFGAAHVDDLDFNPWFESHAAAESISPSRARAAFLTLGQVRITPRLQGRRHADP